MEECITQAAGSLVTLAPVPFDSGKLEHVGGRESGTIDGQRSSIWMTLSFQPWDLYLSPDGEDTWSGKLATPNEQKTDGPLRTVDKARDAVLSLKVSGGFITT